MAVAPEEAVTYADVEDAARALAGRVRETPLLSSGELSRRVGARTLLKAENLQLTGSFKARGATHKIRGLPREALDAGVVAASAGNHAQAVAFAAREAGAHAVLVMPEQAPLAKVAAVRQYGGEVRFVEGGYDEAGAEAKRLAESEGLTVVHAFDQPQVVAGQGTIGLELARQAPELKLVVIPLGGGGLASGIGLALASALEGVRVVGVQAEACAPYIDSLAAAAPDRSALGQHDLRRHRGQAAGRLHAAAGAALRGRGRDRLGRRGRSGHGHAAGALEARRRGRGRRGAWRR